MGEFSNTNITRMPSYEGAATNYRLELKGLGSGDQDTVACRELQNLWARSHYLTRNNALSATAKHRLVTNWIGTGIKVRWMNENRTPAEKVQKKWDEWTKDPALDGSGSFYNIQKEVAQAFMESGEVFGRKYISPRKYSKIPLAIQILEAEFLDPMFTNQGDNRTRYGIRFDEFGKPEAYHFWKKHPGARINLLSQDPLLRQEVPADEVFHLMERLRPGQWRGIPFLAPVMLNIYELDELVDATLQRQKAAQAMSWLIENTNPLQAFAPGVVRQVETEELDPATGQKKRIIQGSAGSVHYLNKGEIVKFASIQDIGSNLGVLIQDEIGKIASALGLTYDQLTGDLSQVNFSSIRAGLNEFRVRVELIQQLCLINLFLVPVTEWWLELFGLYFPRLRTAGIFPLFNLPRVYGVDELKDAQSDLLEVQAGFAPLRPKIEERGYTYEEVLEDRKVVEKSGFVFTSIPQMPQANPNQVPEKVKKQDNQNQPKQQQNDSTNTSARIIV